MLTSMVLRIRPILATHPAHPYNQVMQTSETFWQVPIRSDEQASAMIAALSVYPVRNILRAGAQAHPELPVEVMRDRLVEALAHRLHRLFVKCWSGDIPERLEEAARPALSGAGAQVVALADPFSGWPHPSMAAFHDKAKAGALFGNVDLELAAMWALRERLDLPQRASIVIDPSHLSWLQEKLFTPEHIARRQAFDLSSQTVHGNSTPARPRF